MAEKRRQQLEKNFQTKFAEALVRSKKLPIILKEMIGEGENGWDTNPRFPADEVNCLVWFQLVLCFAYARDEKELPAVMDKIRYYDGNVAYGLRKHYMDHWLKVDPAPLKKLNLRGSSGYQSKEIHLDFEKFKRFHGYPCRLYREDVRTILTEYLTPEGFLQKVSKLPFGYYACLPVANSYYLSAYGKNSGAMGFVHPSFLFVPETVEEEPRGALVFHPSTIINRVIEFPVAEYVQFSTRIFDGYAVYGLDSTWNYEETKPPDKETLEIGKCESLLTERRKIIGL